MTDNKPTQRADGTWRMTNAQRDKLWQLCGNYNVMFREDDYIVRDPNGTFTPGFAEGWVGGKPGTIYVGVEPNGRSHS